MAQIGPFGAILLVVEFVLAITTMSLLCCAYPEQFRKTLWEIGGENGWNSNPRLRIYFYANYEKPPEIPLVWDQRLSESNLAISILSTVICLARMVMIYSSVTPCFSCFWNAMNDVLLSGFWVYSIVAQSSGDFTDPNHPSVRPWYLEKSCDILDMSVADTCVLAKASFVFSVLSLIFFLARSVASVLSLAYWCGSLRILDRGIDMLCARRREGEDRGGIFDISDVQLDEERWRYSVTMEETPFLGMA
ncbi:uncharacterized protein F4822DRAFT_421590 [Hypoxylon trugodes]|uniref:uncharacterized protein n=1 Tax=Hypoxylon trugodes TaxID=326681 RepID=UPI00219EC440|nr:uncharacterized protein F4822DRAFT_421590 [Hypoxylon trugodes]KAI1382928.1 hypothetical protein F4822DRAFT_421590 [Hypoxylon trugodes]